MENEIGLKIEEMDKMQENNEKLFEKNNLLS